MINQVHADSLCCLSELARHLDVCRRGSRVSAWVIVADTDRGRGIQYRYPEYLSRMHQRVGERSQRNAMRAGWSVLPVHAHHVKRFLKGVLEVKWSEIFVDQARIPESGGVAFGDKLKLKSDFVASHDDKRKRATQPTVSYR